MDVVEQVGLVAAVDGDKDRGDRLVTSQGSLAHGGPPASPQLGWKLRSGADDGDGERTGGQPFTSGDPKEDAAPDATRVGGDAQRVADAGDHLGDRGDLECGADDAEHQRSSTLAPMCDRHAPLPDRHLGGDEEGDEQRTESLHGTTIAHPGLAGHDRVAAAVDRDPGPVGQRRGCLARQTLGASPRARLKARLNASSAS